MNYEQIQELNCEQDGIIRAKCKKCSYSQDIVSKAKGHVWKYNGGEKACLNCGLERKYAETKDEIVVGGTNIITIFLAQMDEKKSDQNYIANSEQWNKKTSESYYIDGYIERQSDMGEYRLGECTMNYNGCEVIATYNALVYLYDEVPLPELVRHYEQEEGLTLSIEGVIGGWGISPKRVEHFFQSRGYEATLFYAEQEDADKNSFYTRLQNRYDTFIFSYGNLPGGILDIYKPEETGNGYHTICITTEYKNGRKVFIAHNEGDNLFERDSLYELIHDLEQAGYCAPISIIGIKNN